MICYSTLPDDWTQNWPEIRGPGIGISGTGLGIGLEQNPLESELLSERGQLDSNTGLEYRLCY